MRVAVAGGTGLVGRLVVSRLSADGAEPVVLARANGVDVTTGAGLEAALDGVDAVIDVTNTTAMRRKQAVAFFEAGTTHLLRAGERAGVRRHVILSIVGIDRVDLGYYLGKRRQEELALAGDRPVSILRATQFHEFAGQLVDRSRGPVVAVPRMRVQPVAAQEVADALVELVGGPVGVAPELAGPERLELPDLARAVLEARGSRKRVLPFRVLGAVGRALADGALLPTGDARLGHRTFAEWLSGLAPAAR
jgi:uncharacterized protein YbjT (DUF2867 family)